MKINENLIYFTIKNNLKKKKTIFFHGDSWLMNHDIYVFKALKNI